MSAEKKKSSRSAASLRAEVGVAQRKRSDSVTRSRSYTVPSTDKSDGRRDRYDDLSRTWQGTAPETRPKPARTGGGSTRDDEEAIARARIVARKKARARRHRRFIIVGLIACIAAAAAVIHLALNVHKSAEERQAAEQKQEQMLESRRRAARNKKKAYKIDSDMERVASKYVGNRGGRRFWSWYGFSSHQPWCGCFVSYCADRAGKLGKTVPKFAYVPDGVNWYKQHDRWENSKYKPKSGDLIFFRFKGDGNAGSHVGIVAGVEGGRVYTIEGNRKNRCVKRDYDRAAHVILGYGRT